MRSLILRSFLMLAMLGALPTLAGAQSLAGVVRDTSGAVLPGVTVEASSPALITKVRTGVTDDAGQYRIPDLPPGTYKITFTLPGFSTVVREGLELSGGGVMTIGAEMQVGSLEESITVTGESPVVDVQTARQQTVLDGDIVRALPASRSYGNYIAAIPAIQATGFGGGASTSNNFFAVRGGRSTEGLIQLDGMNVGAPGNGGGVSGYLYDMSNSAEVQVAVSGGLGEADRGGPAFNIIPKTGGNTFSGMGFTSWAGKWGQSSNIDDRLSSFGFGEQPALIKSYDANFAVGGPVLRDRVWFFANTRAIGTYQESQNIFANRNAGDPNAWTWAKAESPTVRNATSKTLNAVRLTYQATQRNKFGFYIDYTNNCSGGAYTEGGSQCRGPGKGWVATGPSYTPSTTAVSPESGSIWDAPAKIVQGTWTSPFSNRLLLESGYSAFYTDNGDTRAYGVLTDFIPVTEQSTGAGVPFANFIYRGFNPAPSPNQKHATWRGAMSYISGSHNMKWGYQAGYMSNRNTTYVGRQVSYRFNNGVPNQLSQRVGTNGTANSLLYNAAFVQDQWTRSRLTIQAALRYETASSWAPAGRNGILETNEFGGPVLLPRTEGVQGYHDISPRVGAAYDVFGTGKTALKVNVGQYLQGAWTGDAYIINNAGSTLVTSINRAWSDGLSLPAGTPGRGDYVAQCDFMNPAANGECGAWSANNWGSFNQATVVNPAVLTGWGTRNRDWQYSAGVQQQIASQVGMEVTYNRRVWYNFFTTHNGALTAADYDEVTITAPRDPRLPNGGGYPVTFLTRNNRSALGANSPYYTTTNDFGGEVHYWHGVDVLLNARMRNGLSLQGGTSTGRGVADTCDMYISRFGRPMAPTLGTAAAPVIAVGIVDGVRACDRAEPWLTSVRGLAAYTVPKVDVLVSAIFRSQAKAQPGAAPGTNGASRTATFRMNDQQFRAATGGRPLATGLAQQDVNLVLPGAVYGDRINNVDMRFAKVVRFGKTKTNVGLDLYNLFNVNTGTTYEQVYDPASNGERWMRPTAVLLPRFMRLNVQVDF
jgi:hypothetical protein